MKPEEKEIQELRRENKRLFNRNKHLEEVHQEDIAQMTLLRRQVDFLMESQEVKKHD